MGMKLTATWTCDRCSKTENIVQGKVPDEWAVVGRMEIIILENNMPDAKLPTSRKLLCDDCIYEYEKWLTALKPLEANSTAVSASGGLPLTDNIRQALQHGVDRKEEAPVEVQEDTPRIDDDVFIQRND